MNSTFFLWLGCLFIFAAIVFALCLVIAGCETEPQYGDNYVLELDNTVFSSKEAQLSVEKCDRARST